MPAARVGRDALAGEALAVQAKGSQEAVSIDDVERRFTYDWGGFFGGGIGGAREEFDFE